MKFSKSLFTILTVFLFLSSLLLLFSGCDEEHTHSFGEWKRDEASEQHFRECECGQIETASHVYVDMHDEQGHWKECSICHQRRDEESHSGGTRTCTSRARCDVCQVEYGEVREHLYVQGDEA